MPRRKHVNMPPSDKRNVAIEVTDDAKSFEYEHVHNVYNKIAPHFSHTRYNPWPGVVEFINSVHTGGLVLDVGCGNGKYFVRDDLLYIGSDVCQPLLEIAALKVNADLYRCNCTNLPFKSNIADLTLSIAVIHHLSKLSDRLQSISELIRCTKKGGLIVIYVWAMEQKLNSIGYRKFESTDVLVPWHLQSKYCDDETTETLTNYRRYYHIFTMDEVINLAEHFKHDINNYHIKFEANNWALIITK